MCLPVSRHREGVPYRSELAKMPPEVGEGSQQPVCSQQERERRGAGAPHRSPLVKKHSDLRVPAVGLWQENPVVRGVCSEIRQIQAQIHPPSPT